MATYYIDFVNGLDTNDGLTPTTAFKTTDKYGAQGSNNIGIFRRGMNETLTADANFTGNGSNATPIFMKGDNGQVDWGSGVEQTILGSGSNTTVTAGSKTVTVVGEDVTATIAAGDGFKLAGDTRVYEVKTVSFSTDTTITLWLPYREISQTGITTYRVPSWPQITCTSTYVLYPSSDTHLHIKDIKFLNGGQSTGRQIYSNDNVRIFLDGVIMGSTSSYGGIDLYNGSGQHLIMHRCRFDNAAVETYGSKIEIYDSILDRPLKNPIRGLSSTADPESINLHMEDVEFISSSEDIYIGSNRAVITGRNVKFTGNPFYGGGTAAVEIFIEDYNGVVGDNRRFFDLGQTNDVASIQSETTVVRSGGGNTSIKCIGSDDLNTGTVYNRWLLNEWVVDADTSSKTYTFYFNLPAAEFTTPPTASELYIEASYLCQATGAERITKLSTGTVLADGNWNTIGITVQPAQAGNLYLKAYYCKTKEATKTNIFYTDTVIDIT